ncbi:MAG TPA: hypothetical protein VK674_06555 [Candidatus Limnocylindria bacterium]|nr:hypothetical protein [Candidatus Limnocylindria bacterium]
MLEDGEILGIGRPVDDVFKLAVTEGIRRCNPDAVYEPRKRPGFPLADEEVLVNNPQWLGVKTSLAKSRAFVDGLLKDHLADRPQLVRDADFKGASIRAKSQSKLVPGQPGARLRLAAYLVDEEPFESSWSVLTDRWLVQRVLDVEVDPITEVVNIPVVMGVLTVPGNYSDIRSFVSDLPAPTLLPPAPLIK